MGVYACAQHDWMDTNIPRFSYFYTAGWNILERENHMNRALTHNKEDGISPFPRAAVLFFSAEFLLAENDVGFSRLLTLAETKRL